MAGDRAQEGESAVGDRHRSGRRRARVGEDRGSVGEGHVVRKRTGVPEGDLVRAARCNRHGRGSEPEVERLDLEGAGRRRRPVGCLAPPMADADALTAAVGVAGVAGAKVHVGARELMQPVNPSVRIDRTAIERERRSMMWPPRRRSRAGRHGLPSSASLRGRCFGRQGRSALSAGTIRPFDAREPAPPGPPDALDAPVQARCVHRAPSLPRPSRPR